jgi:hypothetical protein
VRFDHLLKYEEECFKKRTAIVWGELNV